MRQRKDMILVPPAKDPWSKEDYKNETANLIARRLCLNARRVREWMDTIGVHSLCEITKRFSEDEIAYGVIWEEKRKNDGE